MTELLMKIQRVESHVPAQELQQNLERQKSEAENISSDDPALVANVGT